MLKQSSYIFLISVIICSVFIQKNKIQAQNQDTIRIPSDISYGVYSGIGPGFHSGGFSKFQGIPSCCPIYDPTSALGSSTGFLIKKRLNTVSYLGFRSGFNGIGADFTAEQIQYVNNNGNISTATLTHTLETSIALISGSLSYGLNVKDLSIDAGYWFGIPISATFYQKETVFPGTFLNGSRIRNEISASIPEVPSLIHGIQAGIHYSIPLNSYGSLFLSPELTVLQTLGSISGTLAWNTLQLRGGISVLWNDITLKLPPPLPPPPPPPKVIIPKPIPPLTVSLKVSGDSNNQLQPLSALKVEEIVHYETQPLLPYIFFDEMQSSLPSRYKQLNTYQAQVFSEQELVPLQTIERYYHTINLAAKKLKDNPALSIELRGCASGSGNEKSNKEIGKQRSETIAIYLKDIWNISPNRIRISIREIPDNPSNNTYPEGQAENRRVELILSDPSLFETIVLNDTIRAISPSKVIIEPKIVSGPSIRQWRMSIFTESGQNQFDSNGIFQIESILEWKPDFAMLPRTKDSLIFRFNVIDSLSRSMSAYWNIPYDYISARISKNTLQKGTKQLKTYSLILFDFDKAYLDPRNARLVSNIIKEIPEDATISIVGATDIFGNEDRNRQLAQERANTVGNTIGLKTTSIKGIPGYKKYPNDVPEGRFYNRTVEITVETGGN